MRHRIHNVVFKDNELYIKGDGINFAADGLTIARGGDLSSYTYFGALSVGKWRKYTMIDNLGLCVRAKGRFKLKAWHVGGDGQKENVSREILHNEDSIFRELNHNATCIDSQDITNVEFQNIYIEIPIFEKGLVYFTISDVAEETHIEDAYCYTESEPVDNVRLAINICTYNREKYLTRNISELKSAFLSDAEKIDLEVFILDNASQIPTDRFADDRIHVVHNKNLGGAGGFTRGLCEILKYNDSCGDDAEAAGLAKGQFSHALFMDDDVTIEPESIRRTCALLSYLKDEYKGAFIAGAMLREEQPYIQHENGAIWNAGKCEFIGRGIDLREESALVTNEADYDRDYAAWWYCCMPMSAISYDNLPIPIFVHEDDVEYSLRNASDIITINGICVWHPASLHRRSSANEYYNLRNMFIVNSRYCMHYGASKATGRVLTMLLVALMRHRYMDMRIIRKAVMDFLEGPEYLMSIDQTALHRMITDMGYKFEDVSSELDGSIENVPGTTNDLSQRGFKVLWSEADSVFKRLALVGQLISLNGWLLPRKRYTEVHYMNEHPANLFRTGRLVLYDDTDNKGIISDKEFFQLFEMLGLSLELWFRLLFCYRRAVRLYNEKWGDMTSAKYWMKAFGFDDAGKNSERE